MGSGLAPFLRGSHACRPGGALTVPCGGRCSLRRELGARAGGAPHPKGLTAQGRAQRSGAVGGWSLLRSFPVPVPSRGEPSRRSAFKERAGRRERGRALNGAPGGAPASPLCGQPAGTLQAPAFPRPAPPTPAAGKRRPGGRCGLGPERRKVSGGRARSAPGCCVARGDAGELARGEWHRAPPGQGWPGGALAPRGLAGRGGSAPFRPRAIRSRCLPTWNRAPGGWARREPHPGARSGLSGKTWSLGPAGSSCSREGPSERTCRLSAALPELLPGFIPPSTLPALSQIFLQCAFSVVRLGLLEAG